MYLSIPRIKLYWKTLSKNIATYKGLKKCIYKAVQNFESSVYFLSTLTLYIRVSWNLIVNNFAGGLELLRAQHLDTEVRVHF